MPEDLIERLKKLNSKMLSISTSMPLKLKTTARNRLKLKKIESWLNSDYNKLCKM